jgi:hypothetical protein
MKRMNFKQWSGGETGRQIVDPHPQARQRDFQAPWILMASF